MAQGQLTAKSVPGGSAVVGSLAFQAVDDQTQSIAIGLQQFQGDLYTLNMPSIGGAASLGVLKSLVFSVYMIASAAFAEALLVILVDGSACYVFPLSASTAGAFGDIIACVPVNVSTTGNIQFMVTGMSSGGLAALALTVAAYNFEQQAFALQNNP